MEDTEQAIVVRRLEAKGYLVIPIPNQETKGKTRPGLIKERAPDLLVIRKAQHIKRAHPSIGGQFYVWRGEDEHDDVVPRGYTQASFPAREMYCGVALEMKDRVAPGRTHTITKREEQQRALLQQFRNEGWFGFVACGANEALKVLGEVYKEEF